MSIVMEDIKIGMKHLRMEMYMDEGIRYVVSLVICNSKFIQYDDTDELKAWEMFSAEASKMILSLAERLAEKKDKLK